jgi:hypothetical protein
MIATGPSSTSPSRAFRMVREIVALLDAAF